MGEELNRQNEEDQRPSRFLSPVGEGFDFGIERTESGGVAALTQFDGRSPLVKLGQQGRFELLTLFLDPLLVFVG